jgi:integrase
MSLDRYLQRGKVNGARKGLFTQSVTLEFTLASEQVPKQERVSHDSFLRALPLHFTLVLTCAATALRASEMLALRWSDLLWDEGRIRISKRWANGEDGETKTESSNGYVPLHNVLARFLRAWRA